VIYFIGNEHGAIKIGYTADLNAWGRLNGLQTASADQLTLLGYEDGTGADEGNLHARFYSFRIRGEWFAANDGLLDYILSLPAVNRRGVQGWIDATLPRGNTAYLQQLREQIGTDASNEAKNVLCEANKQAQDIVMAARADYSYTNVLRRAKDRSESMVGAAKKRSQDIIIAAYVRADQIVAFATDRAASDIKELVADSCEPWPSDCRCGQCGRSRSTVREREDGLPWCNSCWVNHAIFDSGRFDVIMAQAEEQSSCYNQDADIKIKCDSCGNLKHGVGVFPLYGEVRVCGRCRGGM
jgi:vacuolar-type H+-ATPase subunit H